MRLGALAMFLKGRAEVVATAIAALPFPTELAASRATWEAVAREELAFLVPTGPSMVGLRIGAQLLDGSARVLDVSLRTVREGGAPITRAAIDLGREEIPAEAIDDLEKGSANELVRTIRETFPAASVRDGGRHPRATGLHRRSANAPRCVGRRPRLGAGCARRTTGERALSLSRFSRRALW